MYAVAPGAAVQVTHNGGVFGVESEDGKTLYFSKETSSGSIWKMPVTGGNITTISTGGGGDLVVDDKNLYWLESSAVIKASLAGDPAVAIATNQSSPSTLLTDGKNVYWSTLEGGELGALNKTPVTGGSTTTLDVQSSVVSLVANATNLYWVDATGAIWTVVKF